MLMFNLDSIKESSVPVQEKVEMEREHVLIVDILDIKEVESKADKVSKMEQWEMKTKHGSDGRNGTIRIRAIDDKKYILGMKEYLPKKDDGPSQAKEYEKNVDKEAFEIFRNLAPMGTIKKRYYFKTAGLVLEVDVFYTSSGELASNWAKVDVEVSSNEEITFTTDHLPFKVSQIIQDPRTKEQELKVKKIFDEEFNLYNSLNILPLDSK